MVHGEGRGLLGERGRPECRRRDGDGAVEFTTDLSECRLGIAEWSASEGRARVGAWARSTASRPR